MVATSVHWSSCMLVIFYRFKSCSFCPLICSIDQMWSIRCICWLHDSYPSTLPHHVCFYVWTNVCVCLVGVGWSARTAQVNLCLPWLRRLFMPADFASENREHWLPLWPRPARPSGGGCNGKLLTLFCHFLLFKGGEGTAGQRLCRCQ